MENKGFIKGGCFFFFLLILAGAGTIPFFFESPSMFYKLGMDKALLRWGKIFGILSFALIIFQPVFISKFSFLQNVFGQKELMTFHRRAAIVLVAFAILHPLLVLGSEDFTFFPLELRYWPAFLGAGVLVMVITTISISYFRHQLGLEWKTWQIFHRIAAPVLTGGLIIHVLKVSKTFESGPPFLFLLGSAVCSLCLYLRIWLLQAGVLKK